MGATSTDDFEGLNLRELIEFSPVWNNLTRMKLKKTYTLTNSCLFCPPVIMDGRLKCILHEG